MTARSFLCQLAFYGACWAGCQAALAADSKAALFGDLDDPPPATAEAPAASSWRGYAQFELAHRLESPRHWSKLRTRAELGRQGRLSPDVKWKASVRLGYDAVFDVGDHYPPAVRDDQRFEAALRETYLDIAHGDWEFRLGRQHVVWGEMVGLFFADVVSARDLREFILPEFDTLRTPQWALRAERFAGDLHTELLWIPTPTYDAIGKPGAEFYPHRVTAAVYRNEVKPRGLKHGNVGLRAALLKAGWDVSAFVYRSSDIQPTFYREIIGPTVYFEPRHERITQIGGTLAKDLGSLVLKAEAVHTRGRKFGILDLADADGLTPQKTLDWAVGLDVTLPAETRFNIQFFQRLFYNHDPRLLLDKHENGYSLYLNHKLGQRWEAQATFIASLNRTDWLFRPRLQWNFEKNWRLLAGLDLFHGPPTGLFGQFATRDRLYSEVRYSF